MAIETRVREMPADEEEEVWEYLEARPDSWRKQLYVKGRNMTVANVVYTMRANMRTCSKAAEDFGLPLGVVEEAVLYYLRHKDVVERDQDEEKQFLKAHGIDVDAPPVRR